jgi:hypothetical protein
VKKPAKTPETKAMEKTAKSAADADTDSDALAIPAQTIAGEAPKRIHRRSKKIVKEPVSITEESEKEVEGSHAEKVGKGSFSTRSEAS